MSGLDEHVIERSKTKLLFLIFGACVFVALGYWLLQMDPSEIEEQRRFNDPWLVHSVGLFSILFFGLCGISGVKKIFDKAPGLVLNANGIYDNSSGFSTGLIPWSEVLGFVVFEAYKQKVLVIKVLFPEKYIGLGNPVRRELSRVSYKLCGGPIAISSNSLKVSFEELQDICNRYLAKYGPPA